VPLHNWVGTLTEYLSTFCRIHLTSTVRRLDSRYQNSAGTFMPLPLAASSKMWVCRHSLAGIVGSNPTGGMDVSFECCVLSGRGFCDGPMALTEESYRVCLCVCVCVCVRFLV
jgi:hypothetical protein